jgi:hypothetical protein
MIPQVDEWNGIRWHEFIATTILHVVENYIGSAIDQFDLEPSFCKSSMMLQMCDADWIKQGFLYKI